MTKRLSPIYWLDVLYNAVRGAHGGVVQAANHLSNVRGVAISPEGLRQRLARTDGKSLSAEQMELLTDYLVGQREPEALGWIKALARQYGLEVIELPPPPAGGWACELSALRKKLMESTALGGSLNAELMKASDDERIVPHEGDNLVALAYAEVEVLLRFIRNVRRATQKEVELEEAQ